MGGLSQALLAGAVALLCDVPAANAYPIIFAVGPVSPSGTSPTGPVNVSASFTLNSTAQTITIALLNLENNIVGVPQAISDIEFTVGNPGTGAITPLGVSEAGGTYVNISKAGFASVPSQPSNQWHAASLSPTVLTLCTVCNAAVGFNNPKQELIGGPDQSQLATDQYTQADDSLGGNGTNRPFLLASGASYTQGPLKEVNTAPVWTVQMPTNALTTTTTITSVTFYFGSVYNTYSIVDTDGITPEPATAGMMVTGLALAVWFGRKRLVRRPLPEKTTTPD